jgi:hypothetical protein
MSTKRNTPEYLQGDEMYQKTIAAATEGEQEAVLHAIEPVIELTQMIKDLTEELRKNPELRQQLAMELSGAKQVVKSEPVASGSKS